MTQILRCENERRPERGNKTGELDLDTSRLVPLLRGYVRGRKAMDALVRKAGGKRGKLYAWTHKGTRKGAGQGSFLTLWAAKRKGVLTIPQALDWKGTGIQPGRIVLVYGERGCRRKSERLTKEWLIIKLTKKNMQNIEGLTLEEKCSLLRLQKRSGKQRLGKFWRDSRWRRVRGISKRGTAKMKTEKEEGKLMSNR